MVQKGTYRLMSQGMETGQGQDIDALSQETGRTRQAQPQAPFLDPIPICPLLRQP